jgi:hypothetical protein
VTPRICMDTTWPLRRAVHHVLAAIRRYIDIDPSLRSN